MFSNNIVDILDLKIALKEYKPITNTYDKLKENKFKVSSFTQFKAYHHISIYRYILFKNLYRITN